jgi:hypothetical protein
MVHLERCRSVIRYVRQNPEIAARMAGRSRTVQAHDLTPMFLNLRSQVTADQQAGDGLPASIDTLRLGLPRISFT